MTCRRSLKVSGSSSRVHFPARVPGLRVGVSRLCRKHFLANNGYFPMERLSNQINKLTKTKVNTTVVVDYYYLRVSLSRCTCIFWFESLKESSTRRDESPHYIPQPKIFCSHMRIDIMHKCHGFYPSWSDYRPYADVRSAVVGG